MYGGAGGRVKEGVHRAVRKKCRDLVESCLKVKVKKIKVCKGKCKERRGVQ